MVFNSGKSSSYYAVYKVYTYKLKLFEQTELSYLRRHLANTHKYI